MCVYRYYLSIHYVATPSPPAAGFANCVFGSTAMRWTNISKPKVDINNGMLYEIYYTPIVASNIAKQQQQHSTYETFPRVKGIRAQSATQKKQQQQQHYTNTNAVCNTLQSVVGCVQRREGWQPSGLEYGQGMCLCCVVDDTLMEIAVWPWTADERCHSPHAGKCQALPSRYHWNHEDGHMGSQQSPFRFRHMHRSDRASRIYGSSVPSLHTLRLTQVFWGTNKLSRMAGTRLLECTVSNSQIYACHTEPKCLSLTSQLLFSVYAF